MASPRRFQYLIARASAKDNTGIRSLVNAAEMTSGDFKGAESRGNIQVKVVTFIEKPSAYVINEPAKWQIGMMETEKIFYIIDR